MDSKGLLRQPWAILGAIGFMSLIQDAIEWQSHLEMWLEAWRTFFRPIGYYLFFGWVFDYFGYRVPDWWSDYFAMGSLCLAGLFRLVTSISKTFVDGLKSFFTFYRESILSALLFWPVLITVIAALSLVGRFILHEEKAESVSRGVAYIKGFAVSGDFDPRMLEDRAQIFIESFLWAAVFILMNYLIKPFIP